MLIIPIIIKPQEPIVKKIDGRPLNELREEIITKLSEFMDYCFVQSTGSKYSLMGPVGKLLTLIKTTGNIDWGKVKGYIANVVRMNQNWIPPKALELLDESCNLLEKINSNINSPILWLNIIDGIDYELFFRLYKEEREKQETYITNKFRDFLQKKYKTIDKVNEVFQLKYQNFDEIPHPQDFNAVGEVEIIKEFWNFYEEEKKKRKKKSKNK
ncbi:MAG: beta-galactosidase [Promethearchaeota archaeon]